MLCKQLVGKEADAAVLADSTSDKVAIGITSGGTATGSGPAWQ